MQKGCLFTDHGQWFSRWADYRGPNRIRTLKSKCLGNVKQLSFESARMKHEQHIASLNLVRRPRDKPLSKMAIQQVIAHIGNRAGLKSVTPHTFRRTFATHLYNHGAGVEVIKALMGHVWIQTTMRYARIGQDRLTKVFEQCHPREHLKGQQASN